MYLLKLVNNKIKNKKNKNNILTKEDLVLWDLFTQNLKKHNPKREKDVLQSKDKKNKNYQKLHLGQRIGLGKKDFVKIKQGKILIEQKLDLHGFKEIEAKKELEIFINNCVDKGMRLVLVITGKGKGKGQGIIKKNISIWLNQNIIRQKILGFDYASPKHGGTGAIYVFLRKF